MSDMHLIMNGWRGYLLQEQKNQLLFEDCSYITKVLGISLPLTESGDVAPLTEHLKQEILREQMLLESFWDDAVQTVKTAAGAVAGKFIDAAAGIKKFGEEGWAIIKQLYRVATNPELIPNFTGAIWKVNLRHKWRYGLKPILEALIQRLPTWDMPNFASIAQKALDTINKVIESVKSMSGWKKAIATAGLSIGFTWIWDKVKDFVEDYTVLNKKLESDESEETAEQFKTWLKNAVNNAFLNILRTQFAGMIEKLISVSTGVKGWWDTAVAAVGGVELVISALGTSLSRFARHTGGGKKINFSKLNAAET
jgi:hypothetical protein